MRIFIFSIPKFASHVRTAHFAVEVGADANIGKNCSTLIFTLPGSGSKCRCPVLKSKAMRTAAILIFTMLIEFVASAQSDETFITSFDPNPQNKYQADKGKAIWSIGKYVYVINGFVKTNQYDRKNQVFMVDADTRQIVREIEFEGPQGDMAISAHWVTSDEHILLTGEWRDYDAGGLMRMFLVKLTPNLETVWINYYPDLSTNYLYSEGIAETEDGDYIIYLQESPPPAPHPTGELRVIKTDTSGTVFFSKMLVDTFTQTAGYGDLTPTDDGHFLISSGVFNVYYYHPVYGTYTITGILHKIDKEANQIWTKTLNYAKFPIQETKSVSLEGGGGAVVWMKDTFVTDPEIAWNFPLIYGIDSDGNRTWTHEWNKWGYKPVYNIRRANNGDILGVGYYGTGLPNKGKGWLFRMADTGQLIWERHYSDSLLRPWSPQLELLYVCEMADGRIAATGIAIDSNGVSEPWNLNVVLLVIDSDGCLEPGCSGQNQYVTSVLEPIFKLPDLPVLAVSPNPAAGPVSISLPESLTSGSQVYELRCYAPNGQLLRRFDWPSGAPSLRIDDWQTDGICYLFLYDRRGYPIASGKMIFHR
jgi:hypothetical protein